MFKRNISYILMFIIVLFGFNMEVRARDVEGSQVSGNGSTSSVQGLTCIYEGGINSVAVKFVQNSNGISVYINFFNDTPEIDDNAWKLVDSEYTIYSDSSKYNNSFFSTCTDYGNIKNNNYYFYDEIAVDGVKTDYWNYIWDGLAQRHDLIYSGTAENNDIGVVEEQISEFTCIYEGGIAIAQNSSGKHEIYKNSNSSADENTSNWKKQNSDDYSIFLNGKISESSFSYCPFYVSEYLFQVSEYLSPGEEIIGAQYRFFDEGDGEENYDNKKRFSKKIDSFDILSNTEQSGKVNDDNYFLISKSELENNACEDLDLSSKWLSNPRSGDVNACLYYKTYINPNDNSKKSCAVLQLSFDKLNTRIDSSYSYYGGVNQTFGDEEPFAIYNGDCPVSVYVNHLSFKSYYAYYASTGSEEPGPQNVFLISGNISGNVSLSRIRTLHDDGVVNIGIIENPIDSCEDLLSPEIIEYINFGINAVKIMVPLALIGLGIVDFARGVFSSEDEMKKIQQKFIKRIILAVAFFLIPYVIKVLLDIANSVWGGIDTEFCGLDLF